MGGAGRTATTTPVPITIGGSTNVTVTYTGTTLPDTSITDGYSFDDTTSYLAGMVYGGHILWKTSANYLAEITANYTDTSTSKSGILTTTNTSLAAYVGDLTNIRGLLAGAEIEIFAAATKVYTSTTAAPKFKYSLSYVAAPGSYDIAYQFQERAMESGVIFAIIRRQQVLLPVFYNAGVPYVRWGGDHYFYNMNAASGNYFTTIRLYAQGFII